MPNKTSFEDKTGILSDLWLNYRTEEGFGSFLHYNDISLPLAYLLHENIVAKTEQAETFIEETFMLLLEVLNVEDAGFDTLDDVFNLAQNNVRG